jgi:hypothetical protein
LLMHYGVEISEERAKELSLKVWVDRLFAIVLSNIYIFWVEVSETGFTRHLEPLCKHLLRLSPDDEAPEELVCQEKAVCVKFDLQPWITWL